MNEDQYYLLGVAGGALLGYYLIGDNGILLGAVGGVVIAFVRNILW